ncbi:MAG: ABC transporter substrate-binding protein [Candidatus Improbicoccus devescovinae]|nr:MAG: ABC transporter substrate-binding protein [Candidatus Improbicoccus devescovinae]
MKKKHIILILFLVIFLGIFLIIFFRKNYKKTSVKSVNLVEVTRSVFYAPQYVAIELGFFEDKNININLLSSSGSDRAMAALLSDQSDIALLGPEAIIYVYNQGRKNFPIAFAQLTQRDGSFLMSKINNEIFNWQNLNNKKIIIGRKGGLPQMVLSYLLKKNKINCEILDNIRLDAKASAFISGDADYVALFEPAASEIASKFNANILVPIGTQLDVIPYTVYCATGNYIKKNNKIIQDFSSAINKSLNWIKNNSAENIALVIKPYFPASDLKTLISSVDIYKKIDAWPLDSGINKQSMGFLKDIMMSSGEINYELNNNFNSLFL